MSDSEESEIAPPSSLNRSGSGSDTDNESFSLAQIPPPTKPPSKEKLLYDSIYDRFPDNYGKKLSRDERKREGYISSTLAYGEIMFESFEELFDIILAYSGNEGNSNSTDKSQTNILTQPDLTFVDVGCGTGKPVFAAVSFCQCKQSEQPPRQILTHF